MFAKISETIAPYAPQCWINLGTKSKIAIVSLPIIAAVGLSWTCYKRLTLKKQSCKFTAEEIETYENTLKGLSLSPSDDLHCLSEELFNGFCSHSLLYISEISTKILNWENNIDNLDNLVNLGFATAVATLKALEEKEDIATTLFESSNTYLDPLDRFITIYKIIRRNHPTPDDFYQKGSREYQWRMLYNATINGFLSLVSLNDLSKIVKVPPPHVTYQLDETIEFGKS